MKKLLSILLCAVMCVTVCTPAFAVSADNYTIKNPYKDIDWESWKGYKTQLHCHTTASDGFMKIKEAVQAYYDMDYDAVAVPV